MTEPCFLWDAGVCTNHAGANDPLCFDTKDECDDALHGYVAVPVVGDGLNCVVALCDPLFSPDESPDKFCYLSEAECMKSHTFYKRTGTAGSYTCTQTMCDPRKPDCFRTEALCRGTAFWHKSTALGYCEVADAATCPAASADCFPTYQLCCAAKGCEVGYMPPACRLEGCDPEEDEDCYPTYAECYDATSPNAKLSRGAIIAICVAVGVVLLAIVLGMLYFWNSSRKAADAAQANKAVKPNQLA